MQMPQISHMLLRVLERCEPCCRAEPESTIANPFTIALAATAKSAVTLSISTSSLEAADPRAHRRRRWHRRRRRWGRSRPWRRGRSWLRAGSTAQTTICQHVVGVPRAFSTGGPSCAILIIIGARLRWRWWRWCWSRDRTTPTTARSRTARIEGAGACSTIGSGLVAPPGAVITTVAAIRLEPAATSTSAWRGTSARRGRRGRGRRGVCHERTNRSNESVLEGDKSVNPILPQICGRALLTTGARPALDAWIGRWLVQRKRRIQPQHVDFHIIPERNRHDVATIQRLAHGRRTPFFCIIVHVPEERLRGVAKSIIDAVGVVRSQDRRRGTRDHVAILDVEPHHLGEIPIVRPVGSEELRHNRNGLQCVDLVL